MTIGCSRALCVLLATIVAGASSWAASPKTLPAHTSVNVAERNKHQAQ
jgi:hypothetical protein